ncbi:MAG: hypothetical protein Q9190_000106 [Brigantiaea leucoxantha]
MGSTEKETPVPFQRPAFRLLPVPPDGATETRQASILRSLPDLVYFNAVHNPDHVFCLQSSQSQTLPEKLEFAPITFRQLACAVDSCCSWLLRNISNARPAVLIDGNAVDKAPPIALFLESDGGLFVYLIALLTLNIPCVLLSIRLNSAAVLQLLEETGALSIIVSSRTAGHIEDALSKHPRATHPRINMYMAAPLDSFVQSSPAPDVFSRFVQCRRHVRENDQNVLILHSSGTTGRTRLKVAIAEKLKVAQGCPKRFRLHTAICLGTQGATSSCLWRMSLNGFGILAPSLALSVGKTVCFPPSSTIPNSTLVLQIVRVQNVTSLMTVPTILEEIVQSTAAKKLASLDFVAVGGGPIKNAVAEMLHRSNVNLLNHFGATELGALSPIFRPDKSYDWRYLRLRTDMGLELKPSEPQTASRNEYKLVGRPFGSGTDFELQDKVEVNPLNKTLEVRLVGRKDDLIVLATGEKVSPNLMENILEQDLRIRRAVVFGNSQFEVGVLIEPANAVDGPREEFVESIWPLILSANAEVDQHARISTKAAILVKPQGRSIPISDKGSLQRREAYSEFQSEISLVYDEIERTSLGTSASCIDTKNLRKSLREMIQSCLPTHVKPETWDDDDDFVQIGIDSLQATRLRRTLDQSFRGSAHQSRFPDGLPLDFVYSHPSVQQIVAAFEASNHADLGPITKPNQMSILSQKYAFFSERGPSLTGSYTVLLTGTTGNLGSHLLQMLCSHSRISTIVCLIRVKSQLSMGSLVEAAESEQRKACDDRRIEMSRDSWSKTKFLAWQPGAEHLGLEENDYRHLASTITHVFHGAWPMDFQLKLSSFEAQLKGLQDLINLARFAHYLRPIMKPRVILASSIAVVGNLPVDKTSQDMVPEMPLHDPANGPLAMGYAEAKWVCEQMMESAYNTLPCELQPMIVRIGQLSGSRTSGFWSVKEHFPTLVKLSAAIGHLPDLQGTLSWLPVDQTARAVADLLLRHEPRQLVYHLENPVRQSWQDVCRVIEYSLGLRPESRLPFSKWLDKISRLNESPSDLMSFFRNDFLHMSGGDLVLDTANCQKLSPTLRSAGPVEPKDIELYIAFWRRSGLLKGD